METAQAIQTRMLSSVSSDYDKNEGSFIYDALKPVAIEIEGQQKEIEVVQSKLDVENLAGDELTRFVYTRTGRERKLATKATTTVIISGSVGASIQIGDIVSSGTINFISLEDKTIDATGQMSVIVECEEFGPVGNVPANSITVFPVTIQGLVSVYNPLSVTNGYSAETDAELKERYYNKLQRPGKAGNKYHYEEWAMEVIGVGDAKVFPRYNGPLSVKVVIIDNNKQPANTELITAVNERISREMPFGVTDLSIVSATALEINVKMSITTADGHTKETVIGTIKENITEYLKGIAFKESYVSYAIIGSVIIASNGVIDYQNLLVNGGTANISVSDQSVAVIGSVSE